ncbi:hypothetical protein BN1723_014294 [Verticillium longisporum]|nr:hypothetical protein BN1723_014294 [Verticillium longisporum]
MKRVYVTPVSAQDLCPDIVVSDDTTEASSSSITIEDRSSFSHQDKIVLTEERSSFLGGAFDHLFAAARFQTAAFSKDDASPHDKPTKSPCCVFLLAEDEGFAVRSDFLVYRLLGCPQVASSFSFLSPFTKISPFTGFIDGWVDISRALQVASGVVLLNAEAVADSSPHTPGSQSSLGFAESISSFEQELEQRLSFPWIQPTAIRQYRVCLVIGPQIVRSWLSRWQAAAALGVRLVILTTGDWWADDPVGPSFQHLKEALISIDMRTNNDESGSTLGDRIAQAVRTFPEPIDGIFTSSDDYLISVAQASEALGLYTPGVKAFTVSTDKFLTRMFSGQDTGSTFAVKSMSDLENQIGTTGDMGGKLQYPVVCKPSIGRGSEGVFRADDAAELRDAVARILAIRDCPNGVVVEDYVAGPEVDANLVLRDGRLLFAEVVDDFPCSADTSPSSQGGTFNETQTHTPSGLPKHEQTSVIEAMKQAVLLQGFSSGVFHCEARVRNSSMDYVVHPDVPFPVLEAITISAKDKKNELSVFLHEINARAPGMGSSTASLFSSGIDYWALQVLCAVRDWSRFEALSIPFKHSPTNFVSLANVAVDVTSAQMRALNIPGFVSAAGSDKGPQPITRIAIDGDAYPTGEIRRSHPDIMQHVPYHITIARPSDWYAGRKGSWRWFTTGVVRSSLSREHALTMVDSFTKSFEELLREGPKGSTEPVRLQGRSPQARTVKT